MTTTDLNRPAGLPRRFELLDARVWLHTRCVDCGRRTGHGQDEPVVLASVVKVLLALEFWRQAAAGRLDPAERVVVRAADRLGGTGTAGFHDDARLSLRDLALLMMSVSDNTVAGILFRRVGLDTVQALARQLGLDRAQVTGARRVRCWRPCWRTWERPMRARSRRRSPPCPPRTSTGCAPWTRRARRVRLRGR
ncbi:serine hydrolase [Streptomyces niveus]